MAVISTFVIFDIETTGLPRHERNRTKITELTFLAVDNRDIQKAINGQVPLINKLSFLFNPQRNIQAEVSKLTGLTNAMLQNQPVFKNRIQSLISFLEELPKPVCLVAHNGNSFDFKILRSEFINASAALPNDLLCVDSLWGFRKILKETNFCHKTLPVLNSSVDLSKSDGDLVTDDEDWPEFNTTAEEWDEIDKILEDFSKLSPQTNNKISVTSKSPKKSNDAHIVHVDKTTAIRNVFEKKTHKENMSCTLEALYKRLLNKEAVNAHRSEADCIMLLECIVAVRDQFLTYANDKCKLISEVKPFEPY